MTQVIIQPSLGNPEARRHWESTIENEVEFGDDPLRAALGAHVAGLTRFHPDRRARFWGTTRNHDANMDTVRTGDIVLFTGKRHVQGIGEVGSSFRSRVVADLLWEPDPERGSYHNVYSLRSFARVAIPYEEIWAIPGFSQGDNFMGARFLRDATRVRDIVSALGITSATAAEEERAAQAIVSRELARTTMTGIVPGEAVQVTRTSYGQAESLVFVNRNEAVLVQKYVAWSGLPNRRLSTPVGPTDLVSGEDEPAEIFEAKSSVSRQHVRQAVGQLLDYAPHLPSVRVLSVLLPEAPDASVIDYATRYGVDVVYRQGEAFVRVAAPDTAREGMLTLVHGGPGGPARAGGSRQRAGAGA